MRWTDAQARFANDTVYDFVRDAVWAGIPASTLREMIAEAYLAVHREEGQRGVEAFR